MNRDRLIARGIGSFIALLLLSVPVWGQAQDEESEQESRAGVYMEEIIVTAEKREASVQDTAASLSAFDDEALERENITNVLDIQFAVPNMLFSAFNFGTPHLSIRGIGREAVGVSADDGTAIHVNGAFTVGSPVLETEFFDMERVEILRGPQGTLYGRNSTGGVVNFISKRPDFDTLAGEVTFTGGKYDLKKVAVMANLPLRSDTLALRIAGYSYRRDGYVRNTHTNNDIDEYDLSSTRLSLRWQTDSVDTNFIFEYFNSNDTRMRSNKQACKTDNRPAPFSVGCEAGHKLETYEPLNVGATLGGIFANRYGLYGNAGIVGVGAGTFAGYKGNAEGASVSQDLREVDAFTDPTSSRRYRSATVDVTWDLATNLSLVFLGHEAHTKASTLADFNWSTVSERFSTKAQIQADIVANQGIITQLNSGVTGINFALTGVAAALRIPNQANTSDIVDQQDLYAYYATADTTQKATVDGAIAQIAALASLGVSSVATAQGVTAGYQGSAAGLAAANSFFLTPAALALDADGRLTTLDPKITGANFVTANDITSWESNNRTFEARLVSDFQESPWDFIAGVFGMEYNLRDSLYEVNFNTLSHFVNSITYGQITAAETAAKRNPLDYQVQRTAQGIPLFDTTKGDSILHNTLNRPYTLGDLQSAGGYSEYDLRTFAVFGEMYRQLDENTKLSAGLRYTEETKTLKSEDGWTVVVLTPNPFLGDSNSRSNTWSEVTGRVGLDHRFGEDAMVYGNLSRSYKSGGFNTIRRITNRSETFEPEYINAVEVGIKSTLAEGRVQANIGYFYYDYSGLQISKIVARNSVNENVDAQLQGLEFEFVGYPVDSVRVDATLSWLDTEVQSTRSINNADPSAGRAGWTTIKGIQAANWLAPTTDINGDGSINGVDSTAACDSEGDYRVAGLVCGTPPDQVPANGSSTVPMIASWDASTGSGTTAGYHGAGAQVPIGFETDLSGNQLPNSPELSAKLGVQYIVGLGAEVDLVLRADYYWQHEFYGRVFNDAQTLISAWDVTNASLGLASKEGNWNLEMWIKNVGDDEHITGIYFTDAAAGNFTNVFLLEPRTYGATWNYKF